MSRPSHETLGPEAASSAATEDLDRRAAARAVCEQLDFLLADGEEWGGAFADHTFEKGLGARMEALLRSHPLGQLPSEEGQRLWRRVQEMIHPDIPRTKPWAGWADFAAVMDGLRAWLNCYYQLNSGTQTSDPGE